MMPDPDLPNPLDCETRALFARFLAPILSRATDWTALTRELAEKGYQLSFRSGRLVILEEMSGRAVCTGRDLGCPLSDLSARLGRPAIRVHASGMTGDLA
ncbi:hypothetical protein [Litorisediminicola beolgyonensis]|uniref:Uncharacterized protein n=1 Tax=Litorisediminicola beolgyonensis TaxID=1173614 RepID=A0ABW3ZII2_9RHOB